MIDFRKILKRATLGRICEGLFLVVINAVGALLNVFWGMYLKVVNGIKYDLSITSQVCYLDAMLNNEYDPLQRRIYIEDTGVERGYFFFSPEEPAYNKFYFGKSWFIKDTRYTANRGFIVVLPKDIVAGDKMHALIRRHKLVGMNYEIINK